MGYRIIPKDLQGKRCTIESADDSNRCVLGISVGSIFINGKHVQKVLEWINSNFDECLILIGDDVQIYNEVMIGQTFMDAKQACMQMGDFATTQINRFSRNLKACAFSIKRWSEFTTKGKFEEYKATFFKYFREHSDFKHSVVQCAENYLTGKKVKTSDLRLNKFAQPLSTVYILEEMAVFSQLIESGYTRLLYPGTFLKVFADIVNGDLAHINTNLKNGHYIELKIKKA